MTMKYALSSVISQMLVCLADSVYSNVSSRSPDLGRIQHSFH